jgi:ribosomal protein S14
VEQKRPSFCLWKYSARYSLTELEKYCRSDLTVFVLIKYFLCQPSKGLLALLKYGIPPEVLNALVMDIAGRITQESNRCSRVGSHCQSLYRDMHPGGICKGCLTEIANLEADTEDMSWPHISD